jgi:uncharacterized protein YoxC
MTADQLNVLLGAVAIIALAVIVISVVVIALAVRRLARDLGTVTAAANKLLDEVQAQVPPALHDLRSASADLARVSGELPPRLERIDALLDEADATVASLRATAETAEDMVRGPAAAVDRARRTVNAAGQGLARGADRLVRSVQQRRGGRIE